MKTSVVVITKNQKSYLERSLPILLKQTIKCEIIMVDSGSTDGAVEYVKKLPVRLVQIKPEKFNYAYAFNVGAKVAKGKYLVRLSGDCIPIGKNWLEEMIKPFSDPKIGAVYGKYIISGRKGWVYPKYWPASRFPETGIRFTVSKEDCHDLIKVFQKRDYILSLSGGSFALLQKIWAKRYFNETLIEAEDAEYAWYLHSIGWDIVYTPRVKTLHEHKETNFSFQKLYRLRWFPIFCWEIIKDCLSETPKLPLGV